MLWGVVTSGVRPGLLGLFDFILCPLFYLRGTYLSCSVIMNKKLWKQSTIKWKFKIKVNKYWWVVRTMVHDSEAHVIKLKYEPAERLITCLLSQCYLCITFFLCGSQILDCFYCFYCLYLRQLPTDLYLCHNRRYVLWHALATVIRHRVDW